MKCTIELAPNGGLRLTTPRGRTVDFLPHSAVALDLLEKILCQWQACGDSAIPAQEVFNGQMKDAEKRREKRRLAQGYLAPGIDWSKPEPTRKLTVLGDVTPQRRKPKPSKKAFAHERAPALAGITFDI